MKYGLNDILAFNSQGVFSVGIVTKIVIMNEDRVLYGVTGIDCTLDILEENIVKCVGNARSIKDDYEEGQK